MYIDPRNYHYIYINVYTGMWIEKKIMLDIDRQVNEQKQMDRQIKGQIHRQNYMDRQVSRQVDRLIEVVGKIQIDRWINGVTKKQTEVQVDRHVDRQANLMSHHTFEAVMKNAEYCLW